MPHTGQQSTWSLGPGGLPDPGTQELKLPGQGPSSANGNGNRISLLEPSTTSSSSTSQSLHTSNILTRSRLSETPSLLLDSQISSLDELLQLLVPPLIHLLSAPPSQLLGRLPSVHLNTQLSTEDGAEQLIRSPGWTREVQNALLNRILPDWGTRLREEGLWEGLLRPWFLPTTKAVSTSPKAKGFQAERRGEGQIQLSTLSVLSSSLANLSSASSSPPSTSPTHPEKRRALLFLSEHLPTSLSLASIWSSVSSYGNEARTQLAWSDAVRWTTGFGDKVGNAFEKEMPRGWERSSYTKMLARLLDELVESQARACETSSELDVKTRSAPPASPFISRLIKQALFSPFWQPRESSLSLELIRLALSRAVPSGAGQQLGWKEAYERSWGITFQALEPLERVTIRRALVEALDGCMRRRDLGGLLKGGEEEGRSFLSEEARRIQSSAVGLLRLFAPHDERDGESIVGTLEEGSEKEEEQEEQGQSAVADLLSLCIADLDLELRSTLGIRTPLMARALVTLALEGELKKEEQRWTFMQGLVQCWAKPERIRRAGRSEEIYLSTLLISSLGHLKDSSIPSSLQTNPTFLMGVSAHIDSNDALVRRMGMLVAELVSAGAVLTTPTEGGRSKKALSFGSSMWDGKGEGREEARVLRRLWKEMGTGDRAVEEDDELEGGREKPWMELWGLAPLEVEKSELSQQPIVELRSVGAQKKKEPSTRRLPERRPHQPAQPASSELDLLGSLRPTVRRPLIVDMGADDRSDDMAKGAKPLKGFDMPEEEEQDFSSSESESSGEDDDDELGALKGLSGMGLDDQLKAAGLGGAPNAFKKDQDEDDGIGSNLPPQKRRSAPIYVNELSPMLKESDRDANRIAIKSAADLLRRKAGWGGEVDENAVDLAYALAGAQNNYGIKSFEERRREALLALVVASPRNAAPCLIELLFSFQYSLAQRVSLLQALAGAARELAGLPPLPESSKADALHSDILETAAEGAADEAVKRAKKEGERRVPEIQRQRAVLVNAKPHIQELSPFGGSNSISSATLGGAVTRPKQRYADMASETFLFPYIGRLRAQLDDAKHRDTLGRSRKGYNGGIGSSSLLGPMMLSRIIDTLSVLVSCASTSLDMASCIAPEVLELTLFVTVTIVPYLPAIPALGDLGGGRERGSKDNASALSGALSGLVLITLDAACEADGGRWLMRNRRDLVRDVREWAQMVFEEEDRKDRVAAALGRAGRASASVLLRLHEMEEDA